MGELKGVMIGAGFFAGFHAEAWRRMPGARVTAIADLDTSKAQSMASEYGIRRVYGDVEAMLESERPDFVDVVTPPSTHRELAALAAGRGIHVLCQKPMAPSMDDCRAMVEDCHRAGVRLLIHENWRWQPWYREAASLVSEGALGRVFHLGFRMRTGDGRGEEPYTVQPYFRGMKRFLLYETAVHFLDTFRYLGGEMAEISCRTATVNPLIAGEDYALIQARFLSGAHGLIDANRISGPLPPPVAFGEFLIEGTLAAVRISPDGRMWMTYYGGEENEHAFDPPRQGYKGDSVWAWQRHAVQCLASGAECESEGLSYLRTVRAVLACYESAEKGTSVKLEGGE